MRPSNPEAVAAQARLCYSERRGGVPMNLEIANRLLALRREHGYSQEELAY